MARFAARVFAAADFLHDQLGAFFGTEYVGLDACTSERWGTQLEVACSVADGEYLVEGDFFASRGVAEIDRQFLAFFNFVLTAVGGENCVHGVLSGLVVRGEPPGVSQRSYAVSSEPRIVADIRPPVEGANKASAGIWHGKRACFVVS